MYPINKLNPGNVYNSKKGNSLAKSIISISIYVIVCNIVIYVSSMNYEQKQPLGLLLVGMVFIPLIVNIYGGLPLDCMSKNKTKSIAESSKN